MITIFTPSYNREKELKILYNSLLKQNYNDFEWLIVDDGSSDNTKKYIASLKKENKIKASIDGRPHIETKIIVKKFNGIKIPSDTPKEL